MKGYQDNSVVHELEPMIIEKFADKSPEQLRQYEYKETSNLVRLVQDAAALIRDKGEAAFTDFRIAFSQWRQGEIYIFVLDPNGNMLVHADPEMEGHNQLGLKDINGKPIVSGLIRAATNFPDKPEGWYHYQWAVPGGLLPRWKSSFVKLVKAPSGNNYIVGCGMYNDRMERAFVVDIVNQAVAEVEKIGKSAFQIFHDPTGPYLAKEAYIFVIDMNGVELVNPAFPNIEGREMLNQKDTNGKFFYKDMIQMIKKQGVGWLEYMWPKPGESISTQKSAYIKAAKIGDQMFMVGCGVYLAEAPRDHKLALKPSASELISIVEDAADILQKQGEKAYQTFREKGSKWFHDDTYLFVFTMDGIRSFHPVEPETEGRDDRGLKDILGRPIVKMFIDATATNVGKGWAHYMYPEPGDIFPAWKSSYVKRVTFPSGKEYIVGSGIYNMEMNKSFIEDVVNRAAELVAVQGKESFSLIRDKKGPFVFMDTYVFIQTPEGKELVNPVQPSLEGKNLIDLKDIHGKEVIKDEISAAMSEGSAWLECFWYRPGDNKPVLKQTFVKKVQFNKEVYILGSGYYGGEIPSGKKKMEEIQKISWQTFKEEKLNDKLSRQMVFGKMGTMGRFTAKAGANVTRHYHENEEYSYVLSGALKFNFDDREFLINEGDAIVIPAGIPHSVFVEEDAVFVDFFVPAREDWLRGEDQYLRK